jgi:hypothetical protein
LHGWKVLEDLGGTIEFKDIPKRKKARWMKTSRTADGDPAGKPSTHSLKPIR